MDSLLSEEDRIKAVYAGRTADDIRYSAFNSAHLLAVQQLHAEILALLHRRGHADLRSQTILDVGCGRGELLRRLLDWGARPANVVGIDLLPERIAEAKALSPADLRLVCGSARQLDLPSASFDLVFQLTVFTSILERRLKQEIAAEMMRVLRPDGLIVWYDYYFNNPRNPNVRGVGKREISELFPGCAIVLRRITLAPPLARALAPYSTLLCQVLGRVAPLCTHYLGSIQKHHSSPTIV
ncbi:MAG TPA: class I SAM-dependent methyltransferase [Candidatus Binataceae bacterium]|nr:class I SAM-dependent methyltransferase [Candidatus Binataceae bacterium]